MENIYSEIVLTVNLEVHALELCSNVDIALLLLPVINLHGEGPRRALP